MGESLDPIRRRGQLQTGNPHELELESIIACSDSRLERELHALLTSSERSISG